jgi:hypothetical protein
MRKRVSEPLVSQVGGIHNHLADEEEGELLVSQVGGIIT